MQITENEVCGWVNLLLDHMICLLDVVAVGFPFIQFNNSAQLIVVSNTYSTFPGFGVLFYEDIYAVPTKVLNVRTVSRKFIIAVYQELNSSLSISCLSIFFIEITNVV